MDIKDIRETKRKFGIVGNCEALNLAIERALQVAATDLSVLITGESGVGKEAFPKIIHENSRRKHHRYIAVNCGAIPEGTIDSELFGHEKGAFTGAIGERQGYFGETNGGTIFLDEVGELPLATQARLLRVLESGEYIRVGSSKVEKTDVRIVAATNVKLMEAIANGRFREDLYYRLNTVPIQVPPLRERGEDIALLFRMFANEVADKYHMPMPIELTEEARSRLMTYPWPGNVRQLKNLAERISVIEKENRVITPEILQSNIPEMPIQPQLPALTSGHAGSGGKTFESEREILYQILFDLRRDVTELKRLVHTNLSGQQQTEPMTTPHSTQLYQENASAHYQTTAYQPQADSAMPTINIPTPQGGVRANKIVDDPDIQDTEEYLEESLSLNDMQRDTIRKALEKHHGKRKNAAKDLNISERTLYRKIKEYGLE